MTTTLEKIAEKTYDGVPTVIVSGLRDFLINQTFDCGQCFRFDKIEDPRHACTFEGVAQDRYVRIAQDREDEIYIYNCTKDDYLSFWQNYLSLDTDYGKIKEDILSKTDATVMPLAIEYGRGIRILRQDPWEAICSFIVSQNNNIPRIKKIISSLCEQLGEKIITPEPFGVDVYSFPDANAFKNAGVDFIFSLKTGFRAKYITDAAERACGRQIDYAHLKKADTDDAIKHLCEVKGIGPKVASCALLFGFEKYDAFPIDVWVKRVLQKYFPANFDYKSLGKYAGIAQQYLFYYERYNLEKSF